MTYAFQPPGTFRGLVELRSPSWLRGDSTSALFQIAFGLTADECAESIGIACRMHLLDDPESPDDILPVIGQDRGLPQYAGETAAAYRQRLIDAWAIYPHSGSSEVIEEQILAAGYGPTTFLGDWGNPDVAWGDSTYFWGDLGAYIEFRPYALGPRGEAAPYATQFWLVFNTGFHPVTGPPAPWGSWTWGDTWLTVSGVWAPQGMTADFYRTIIGIVKKWKPSRYVFRGFTFILSNITWGDASITWGDATIPWGGAIDADVHVG